jgi:hypothetical protein
VKALVTLAVVLGLPAIVPAVAVTRRWVVAVFLAPLIGAGMAAVAATIELGAGGSIEADYVAVAVAVNVAVAVWWLAAQRSAAPRAASIGTAATGGGPSWWGWPPLTLTVVLGCLAVPLLALRAPMMGWDANSIWLTHAFMVYGGHNELLTGLRNVAYQFSNPDYPPLVPAVGALAFKSFGFADLHLAPALTVLLSACALGIVGTGVAATRIGPGIAAGASAGRRPARIAAVVAAGAICIAGFGVSGVSEVEGYTDLLWAAAAVAAVVWGLVLPRSTQALGVAWICAAAASLTKNEGLTTALIILVLIALRYRPLNMAGPAPRRWAERAAFIAAPALPGLAWAALIRHIGVRDAFFKSASAQSPLSRAEATYSGMAAHLAVLPLAVAVLLAGCWFLREDRERARLANPAWLWITCLGGLASLFATYMIGGLDIHWWLGTSVSRTTIFAQVLLYTEVAIWILLAMDGLSPGRTGAVSVISAGRVEPADRGAVAGAAERLEFVVPRRAEQA